MVKIALQIKATLESIDKLYTNHPYYQWFLKLKCGSCGEVTEKFHDLTEAEKIPQKHNRSETNLLIKCKLCSRENSIDVVEGSNGQFRSSDEGKFKTLVIFDCRGVEPVDFEPKSGWIAVGEDDGKTFEDVDLTEKEWADYDDKNQNSVGVYELEWQFVKVK
ncbi:UPF0587 protein GA18326 [Helicoverpa armigera]|uniref:DUF866 domain-containing protein n=1 Tax=Helicoverpa armigera TaxID=29058 RepID=A0A2W1BKK1_HELAM|nr:UPF0587 protein GA18326 [Helicoverpa armigera]XP_047027748.1 UPF0587 protein GA18326 [Helicoverpa zea]PZC72203.1 hypothetical protein B5X24_HaOG211757 [Helicoverpa armigera]